jgi:hypothetical protein
MYLPPEEFDIYWDTPDKMVAKARKAKKKP